MFYHFFTKHAFDRQTDGQTDGQTDRILIARPRLHSMQRGKNEFFEYHIAPLLPNLSPITPILGQAVPKIHANNNRIFALNVRESPKLSHP